MEKIPGKQMDLEKMRTEINKCDRAMIEALANRMKIIPFVAEYKKENGLERYQPERERNVIENRKKIAAELNLSEDLVQKIMELIIEDSHRIEKGIMGE